MKEHASDLRGVLDFAVDPGVDVPRLGKEVLAHHPLLLFLFLWGLGKVRIYLRLLVFLSYLTV